jgi:hypothetical protein
MKGEKADLSSTFISEATNGISSTFYFEAIRCKAEDRGCHLDDVIGFVDGVPAAQGVVLWLLTETCPDGILEDMVQSRHEILIHEILI